jgi:hypothetical protein
MIFPSQVPDRFQNGGAGVNLAQRRDWQQLLFIVIIAKLI